MYGVKVGIANKDIPKGAAVSTENMDNAFNENISFENVGKKGTLSPPKKERYFWDTHVRMDQQVPKTYGFFFLWFFVKIEM